MNGGNVVPWATAIGVVVALGGLATAVFTWLIVREILANRALLARWEIACAELGGKRLEVQAPWIRANDRWERDSRTALRALCNSAGVSWLGGFLDDKPIAPFIVLMTLIPGRTGEIPAAYFSFALVRQVNNLDPPWGVDLARRSGIPLTTERFAAIVVLAPSGQLIVEALPTLPPCPPEDIGQRLNALVAKARGA